MLRDCGIPDDEPKEGELSLPMVDGYLLNAARNFAGSIGISLANTELMRRVLFHRSRLVGSVIPSSSNYQRSSSYPGVFALLTVRLAPTARKVNQTTSQPMQRNLRPPVLTRINRIGLQHFEHAGGGGFLGMGCSRWIRREHYRTLCHRNTTKAGRRCENP